MMRQRGRTGADKQMRAENDPVLRRLRRKLVLTSMLVGTIILLGILSALYLSAVFGYKQRDLNMLREAIRTAAPEPQSPADGQESVLPDGQGTAPPGMPQRGDENVPVLVTEYDRNGNFRILTNRLAGIDAEAAEFLTEAAAGGTAAEGVLSGDGYRYLSEIQGPSGSIRYAFLDIYIQQNALRSQLLWSVGIGLITMLVFWGISVHFAAWAIGPVAEAWQKQQQFVSDASHELRTPLSVILANTGLLLQESGEKERQRLCFIDTEAKRMKELTEMLLQLARSDRGYRAAYVPVDFAFLLRQRTAVFEPLAYEQGKRLILKQEAMQAAKLPVEGNEIQLTRLIDILYDNACKYGSKNSDITAVLSARKQGGRKEDMLEFSVKSCGLPLSKEEQEKIFRRFYRGDQSRGGVSGYGLGLSLAQSIVKDHGGEIRVSSDQSGTNTFTVYLPVLKNRT